MDKVGTIISKNSRQGGGEYVVIAHINCDRCKTIIEEREIQEPTKTHRRSGHYYQQYSWCHNCGLYKGKNKKYIT